MPDNLNELGKLLNQTKKDIKAALDRDYPAENIIERGRDIFDSEVPFELEFVIPSHTKIVTLDVVFSLPPDLCCAGTICGVCEIYTTSGPWTTTYTIMPNSVVVIKMFDIGNPFLDEYVLTEGHGDDWTVTLPNTVNSFDYSGTPTEPIKICYAYNTLTASGVIL